MTFGAGSDEDSTWSPDGYFIAFASNRSGPSQIYLTTKHGDEPILIPTGPVKQHPRPGGNYSGRGLVFFSLMEEVMKKLGIFGLIVLVFCLAMAGGCSKKVSSTPCWCYRSWFRRWFRCTGWLDPPSPPEAQRLAELQRQAIEKIGADKIYFAFDSNELSQESRQVLTDKAELLEVQSCSVPADRRSLRRSRNQRIQLGSWRTQSSCCL